MTAKTTAERVAALRQRREGEGLVRLEVYAHPDDHAAIKNYVAKKVKARMKAGEVTGHDIYATFARSPRD